MVVRALFSLAAAIVATLLGGLLLNGLYPVVGQGLAGGPIVIFRALVVGILAMPLAWLLFPRLPARMQSWLLYLFGVPAVCLLLLLFMSIRQARLEQDAHLAELFANLPTFKIYLANSHNVRTARFIDLQFDSAEEAYTVRYDTDRLCTGSLPPTAKQKGQLLGALRNIEGLFLNRAPPCHAQSAGLLYSLNFEIHDYKPPHTQYTAQLDEACLRQHPAFDEVIAVIARVHDDLKFSEHCE